MVAISCMNPASLLLCFTVKDPFTISTNQHPNSTARDMLTLSCDMLEFVFFFSLMDTTQSSCLILDYKFPTAPIHGSIHEGRLLGTTRRQRERRLKSVFALFQSLSQLLPPTYFVKCSRTLQELNSKGPFYGGGGGASWCPYHTNVCKIRDFVQQYLCSLSSNGDQYTLTVLYR